MSKIITEMRRRAKVLPISKMGLYMMAIHEKIQKMLLSKSLFLSATLNEIPCRVDGDSIVGINLPLFSPFFHSHKYHQGQDQKDGRKEMGRANGQIILLLFATFAKDKA